MQLSAGCAQNGSMARRRASRRETADDHSPPPAGLASPASAVVAAAGLAACYTPGNLGHMPTEADFMTHPARHDAARRCWRAFGPPTWTFGVRQENLTIWNYRYYRGDCVIYQVSMRPDGTVRDVGTGWDPACDGPPHPPMLRGGEPGLAAWSGSAIGRAQAASSWRSTNGRMPPCL